MPLPASRAISRWTAPLPAPVAWISSLTLTQYKIILHFPVGSAILFAMAKRTPPTHPQARRRIQALGARLRAARMRRRMTQEMLAERVGVSVPTIGKLESGDPSTSLATVLRVLAALGLSEDIDLLAADDQLGRELQDNALKRSNPRGRQP
jgi:DNA-binding XRE family transcriptional regulator